MKDQNRNLELMKGERGEVVTEIAWSLSFNNIHLSVVDKTIEQEP